LVIYKDYMVFCGKYDRDYTARLKKAADCIVA
jgi:hypothetical protein